MRQVTERDALLLQMGKVSSTSIANALAEQGFNAMQAHIASTGRLAMKLDTLASPTMSDEVADRVYADFLRELEVTYMLARRRLDTAGKHPKLLVISPMRDPLTWFWSHFAELFDHYRNQMLRYHTIRGGLESDFNVETVFLEVQQAMFRVLEEVGVPLHRTDSLTAIKQCAQRYDQSDVVFAALNRFLLPLRWYDEDFRPATGINVYKQPFDIEAGWGQIEHGGLSILLLRYERLHNLVPVISGFTGTPGLKLGRANTAERKNLPFDIRDMQRRGRAMMPAIVVERLYASPYARHFGYCDNSAPVADDPQAGTV